MRIKGEESVIREESLTVPATDGTRLVADVYRPRGSGRRPVLVMRTPYGRRRAETIVLAHPSWFARHGFVVVVQDVRGRGDSGGKFDPFVHEGDDSRETIAWCAEQSWSNGRVGMYGFSYPGLVQLLAAAERPEALKAVAPALSPQGLGEGFLFNGGAFALAMGLGWALDLGIEEARRRGRSDLVAALVHAAQDRRSHYTIRPLRKHPLACGTDVIPFYSEWLDNARNAHFWTARSVSESYGQIEIPAFHIAGWYDLFLNSTLQNYLAIHRATSERGTGGPQQLTIGPWNHYPGSSTGATPGDRPGALDDLLVNFFSRWLRDHEGTSAEGPVTAYVTGANRWAVYAAWPPDSPRHRLYVRSGGKANSVAGDGWLSELEPAAEDEDVYVYDPLNPVEALDSLGPGFPQLTPVGSTDQRSVEALPSVAVYSTEPLSRSVLTAGEIRAVIYTSSDASATDWVVTLCDVSSSGTSCNVARGIVRVFPDSYTRESIRRTEISLGHLCHNFSAGHQVRVQITSSCFPTWEPNPNTGSPLGTDAYDDFVVATQRIHHHRDYPSHIDLPWEECS